MIMMDIEGSGKDRYLSQVSGSDEGLPLGSARSKAFGSGWVSYRRVNKQ